MKRRLFAAIALLALVLVLAVPALAAETGGAHFAAYSADYGSEDGGILTPLLVGVGVSGLICFGLVSLQKSVHKKTGATDYITEEGVHISHASDRFTHTTQTRRKLQTNTNGKK